MVSDDDGAQHLKILKVNWEKINIKFQEMYLLMRI